jgi:hypothetical protein
MTHRDGATLECEIYEATTERACFTPIPGEVSDQRDWSTPDFGQPRRRTGHCYDDPHRQECATTGRRYGDGVRFATTSCVLARGLEMAGTASSKASRGLVIAVLIGCVVLTGRRSPPHAAPQACGTPLARQPTDPPRGVVNRAPGHR